jgi:hypothetical protein
MRSYPFLARIHMKHGLRSRISNDFGATAFITASGRGSMKRSKINDPYRNDVNARQGI